MIPECMSAENLSLTISIRICTLTMLQTYNYGGIRCTEPAKKVEVILKYSATQ